MSVRRPVRLLDIADLAKAYPLELLADFATGNLTLVKSDGTSITHKKPGSLTVTQGTTTLLAKSDLSGDLTLSIPEVQLPSLMTGASATVAGTSGLVPAPIAGEQSSFLRGDGTWAPISGNATTATKLATARTIGLSGVTATAQSFDGSANITIPITAVPASIVTGLATVATSGDYADLTGTPTIPAAATTAPLAAGTAAVGTGTTWARADHVHPLQTTISGNAGSATKLATARTIGLSGVTATAQSFNGTANITIPITAIPASLLTGTIDIDRLPAGALERLVPVADQTARYALTTADVQNGDTVKQVDTGILYFVVDDTNLDSELGYSVYTAGAATSVAWSGITDKPTFATVATTGSYNDLLNLPSIPAASSTTPLVAGTAAVGTGTTWARADHVHPAQTTVSGNAGSATKLATARTIGLSGVTATAQSFNGTANITIPITAVPADIVTGLATVATSGAYSDLTGTPSIPAAATTAPLVAGTAAVGTGTTWARADHVHPAQTSVSGNAGTATTLATARTLTIGSTGKTFDGSADVAWTLAEIGAAAASHTHSYLPLTGGTLTGTLTSRAITVASGYTLTVSTAGNVSGIAVEYSATITTTWSGTSAPYTQTITVTGIKATDVPIVDYKPSGTYSTDSTAEENFMSCIHRITTAANSITVYAHSKPSASIPIRLRVIR